MKLPIRYFSIGLFTATIILLIIFTFFYDSKSDSENLSIDDLILKIEDQGYHVLTEAEYITYSVAKDNNEESTKDQAKKENENSEHDDKNAEDDQKSDDKKEVTQEEQEDKSKEEEEEIFTYTLIVEPNMLGPTVSKLLLDHQIIDDAEKFNRYLEVEGYAPYIQIGEHELTSDMSYYEIAEKIAK